MIPNKVEAGIVSRKVRICRPAFQDMHHLVMPRLAARAQLRRHAMKLRFWSHDDEQVADLELFQISNEELWPEPDGTICVLSILRVGEPLFGATLEMLRCREIIARERLRSSLPAQDD